MHKSFARMCSTGHGALQKVMKAIRVSTHGGPEVLEVHNDVPVPEPEDDQVLVRVKATGVNPVDAYIRTGTYTTRNPTLPYTPGMDCSGIVEAVGCGVDLIQKGDRVFCTRDRDSTGTYAEFVSIKAHSCYYLPEVLSFAQGAAIGVPYFTAYRALIQKCNAKPAQSVLVHGASGAVGLAAVQMARAYGCHPVVGTAGTQEGVDLIQANGAHFAFNHNNKNYLEELKNFTNNLGFDVILEMLSNVNLDKDLMIVKADGIIGVIGCKGSVRINPRSLMNRESRIIGVSLMKATPAEWAEMGSAICAGVECRWVNPVIDQVFPLDQCPAAHKEVLDHSSGGARGKIVLEVQECKSCCNH